MKKCDTLNMYSLFPKLSLVDDLNDPCREQKEFFTVEVGQYLAAVCRVSSSNSSLLCRLLLLISLPGLRNIWAV